MRLPNACIRSAIGTKFPICCAMEYCAISSKNGRLNYLLLHNIDSLGVDLDPALLSLHIQSGGCLSFEVISLAIGRIAAVGWRVSTERVRLLEGIGDACQKRMNLRCRIITH